MASEKEIKRAVTLNGAERGRKDHGTLTPAMQAKALN